MVYSAVLRNQFVAFFLGGIFAGSKPYLFAVNFAVPRAGLRALIELANIHREYPFEVQKGSSQLSPVTISGDVLTIKTSPERHQNYPGAGCQRDTTNSFETVKTVVGLTGFEPATSTPPV